VALTERTGAIGRRTPLTPEEFEALLAHLAPDRDEAGERYEDVRRRLVRLFEWRLCETPEDLADEAINRVARHLAKGTEIRSESPFAYFCGVAHHVAQEMLRERERERRAFAAASALAEPEPEPDAERRLACLQACLGRLPAEQRRVILQYHQESARGRIDGRQRLAHELGITVNALRIHAHRLRRRLEDCCHRCLAEPEGRMKRFAPPRHSR
jgi:RNA polymerase sigma factor (sigma-70 family)